MKAQTTPLRAVLVALLASGASLFAQDAKPAQPAPPAAQADDEDARPRKLRDQDIEMLRTNLRQKRKEIMAENLGLTPEESTKFWPIFDQYRKEAIKPNDLRWEVIKGYADNFETMTEDQAKAYIKRANEVDQQLLALRMKYVPIIGKVISARKTARWYQIDGRIDLLINLQLCSDIPMVSPK